MAESGNPSNSTKKEPNRSMIARLRRALKSTNGAVAIEFAILLPVLIAVLFGIIQYGLVLNTRQLMVYAAREAARSYAVGESTEAEAEALVVTLINNNNLNPVVELSDDGTDVTIDVSVPMSEAAIVNALASTLMEGNIEVSITMRLES